MISLAVITVDDLVWHLLIYPALHHSDVKHLQCIFLHQIFLLCFVLCPPLHFLVNSFWCCFSMCFWAFPGLLSKLSLALCLLHAGCLWRESS